MLIKQLSIFIENKKGHLASITKVICDAGIDIRAISVFDSSEFGTVSYTHLTLPTIRLV